MPWPTDTAWPASNDSDYGSGIARIDGADVIWARDVNFLYTQTKAFQEFLGNTGELIGEQPGSGNGPGGLISPNDPATDIGIELATWGEYIGAAGEDIFRIIDDRGGSGSGPTIVAAIDEAGIMSTSGGLDIGSTEYLEIPHGNTLPATFQEGRLFRKDDTDTLYHADGSSWTAVGTSADKRGATIIVGNSAAGDVASDCDYLDTGNGVQLQAALTAAATNDDDVFVRRGVYDLGGVGASGSRLTVPDNVRVVGAGRNQTILQAIAAGGDGTVLEMGAGCSVEDLYVYAPVPTANQASGWGLIDITGSGCSLERVTLEFEGGWSTIADVAWVDVFTGIYVYGTIPLPLAEVRMKEVKVLDGPQLGLGGGSLAYGIYMEYVNWMHLEDLQITGFEYSTYFLKCLSGDIQGMYFSDWERYGISLDDCKEMNIHTGRLLSDGLQAAIAYGVDAVSTDHCVLRDITIETAGGGGGNTAINLASGSTNWFISGCRGDGTWNGTAFINLAGSSNNNIVMGNQFGGDGYTDSSSGNDFAHNQA